MADTRGAVVTWAELESDRPRELIDRRVIQGEHMTIANVNLYRGFRLESHSHPNEQVAIVLSGRIRFVLTQPDGKEEFILTGGQVLHLPPDVPHAAEALEDTVVLDVFSPAIDRMGLDEKC